MQEIKLSNDASQEFRTVLNGTRFRLLIEWIDPASGWFITIMDINRNILTSSVRMKTGVPVTTSVLVPELTGDIVILPVTRPVQEPGRQAWNNTHKLIFLTGDELEAYNVKIF